MNPERTKGNQRISQRKILAKLKLVLRGEKLGFSLEVLVFAKNDLSSNLFIEHVFIGRIQSKRF